MEKDAQSQAVKKEFNSQTIQTMGYREIIEANRSQHKGTFMDRTWRLDPAKNGSAALEDPDLSPWQKLVRGGYSYHAVSARFTNNYETQKRKVAFIESLFARKQDFASEEDRLLLKRAELLVLKTYNNYRILFTSGAVLFSAVLMASSYLSLGRRLIPVTLLLPFVFLNNDSIGKYKVQQ